ncbi:MAG: hypothetical protein RR255_00045 [Bacilli bacterium]
MTIEFLEERIKEIIEDMNEDEKVVLHNNYGDTVGYTDNKVYLYEKIDTDFIYYTPTQIINMLGGLYNMSMSLKYWNFDGYENAEVTDINNLIDIDGITKFIIDYDNSLECTDIQELLDLYNENICTINGDGYNKDELEELLSEIFKKISIYAEEIERFDDIKQLLVDYLKEMEEL